MDKNVMVIGDVMLDEYVNVTSTRRAAEADIPVWDRQGTFSRLGGAANVAANVRSLLSNMGIHGNVDLYGIYSNDREFGRIVWNSGLSLGYFPHQFSLMKKTRYFSNNKILFREDNFKKYNSDEVEEFTTIMKGHLDYLCKREWDAIVVSDYDKGVITREIMEMVVVMAKDAPIIVDSKRRDLSIFKGSHVMKLNEIEFDIQQSTAAHGVILTEMFPNVVVTLGANGSNLITRERSSEAGKYITHSEHFPAEKAEVVDVTGCGDTHTAAMTVSLMNDKDMRAAVRFANKVASNVVSMFGTSVAKL